MLGVLAVGGWWFLNNYKSLLGGGGGGAGGIPIGAGGGGELPPSADGTGAPDISITGDPVDKRVEPRALFESKHGLSSLASCANTAYGSSSTKSCKCVTEGGETAIIAESKTNGNKCTLSRCGRGIKGCPKCACTFPENAKQYATKAGYLFDYESYSAVPLLEYAHGFPRTRLKRAREMAVTGN